MKSKSIQIGLLLVVAGCLVSLLQRVRVEHRNRTVALVVDWPEYNASASRDYPLLTQRLQALRDNGITALMLPSYDLGTLVQQGQVHALGMPSGSTSLQSASLWIQNPILADQLYWEWSQRGIVDLQRPRADKATGGSVLTRTQGTFAGLETLESGYDAPLIALARQNDVRVVLRILHDPWLPLDAIASYLRDHPVLPWAGALHFENDDPPGGHEALPLWVTWMRSHSSQNLMFEFKPSRASLAVGHALPGQTFRAHTIPVAELKAMDPEAEVSRWRRAAVERSCRYLLIHVSPNSSTREFFDQIRTVRKEIASHHLQVTGWPQSVPKAQNRSRLWNLLLALIALAVAIAGPILALYMVSHAPSSSITFDFLKLTGITLLAACVVAALSYNPETSLQLTPFRGVKIAFLLSWLGSLLVLYPWRELTALLERSVKRWDLLIAAVVLAGIAYALIRSGNASAGFKPAGEQSLRDNLETWLSVRPRFKEFAIGHPLLLLGLYARRFSRTFRGILDPRALLWAGMIGQVSVMNTFCHLHSPFELAFIRSVSGILFGLAIGWGFLFILKRFERWVKT